MIYDIHVYILTMKMWKKVVAITAWGIIGSGISISKGVQFPILKKQTRHDV